MTSTPWSATSALRASSSVTFPLPAAGPTAPGRDPASSAQSVSVGTFSAEAILKEMFHVEEPLSFKVPNFESASFNWPEQLFMSSIKKCLSHFFRFQILQTMSSYSNQRKGVWCSQQ